MNLGSEALLIFFFCCCLECLHWIRSSEITIKWQMSDLVFVPKIIFSSVSYIHYTMWLLNFSPFTNSVFVFAYFVMKEGGRETVCKACLLENINSADFINRSLLRNDNVLFRRAFVAFGTRFLCTLWSLKGRLNFHRNFCSETT